MHAPYSGSLSTSCLLQQSNQSSRTRRRRKPRKIQNNRATRRALKWTSEQCCAFVEHTAGLPLPAKQIRMQSNMTGRQFLEMTPKILCDIGIANFSDQTRILACIKKLRRGDTTFIPEKEATAEHKFLPKYTQGRHLVPENVINHRAGGVASFADFALVEVTHVKEAKASELEDKEDDTEKEAYSEQRKQMHFISESLRAKYKKDILQLRQVAFATKMQGPVAGSGGLQGLHNKITENQVWQLNNIHESRKEFVNTLGIKLSLTPDPEGTRNKHKDPEEQTYDDFTKEMDALMMDFE